MYQKGLPSPRQSSMPNGEQEKASNGRDWKVRSTVRTLRIPRSAALHTRWWTGTLSLIALYTHFRLLACSNSILLRQCEQSMEYGGSGLQDAGWVYVPCMQGAVQLHDSSRAKRQTACKRRNGSQNSPITWLVICTWWLLSANCLSTGIQSQGCLISACQTPWLS